MGLADFLAQAGNRTAIGQVAQAFGGRTVSQQAVDDFINNQLPALADEIHKATTKDDVARAGQSLITGGLKAGINPQGLEHLMSLTVGPALQNLKTGELEKLGAGYVAQPGLEASPRPESSPSLVKGPNVPAIPATPEKPLDLNFMMKFGQATGAKPEEFNKMLETPAINAGKELSNRKTLGEINKELQAQRQRQNLPNTPLGPGLPSLQDIGTLAPAGLPQTLPQREKPEDPLLEERRRLIEAQAGAATAQAGAANARAGAAGREGHGSAMMQDFIRLGGDPNDREAFLAFADTYRGKTDQTQSDQAYGSLDREIDLKAIARDAHTQGKTSSADIKALAAQRGLEVVGNPQLTVSGGAFGYGGTPSLTGNFELKKKPRVTTKGKTGGQGRYSEGVPSGSAPVPKTSEAGGAGNGGGSGNKPQRMKFNAQGELIK